MADLKIGVEQNLNAIAAADAQRTKISALKAVEGVAKDSLQVKDNTSVTDNKRKSDDTNTKVSESKAKETSLLGLTKEQISSKATNALQESESQKNIGLLTGILQAKSPLEKPLGLETKPTVQENIKENAVSSSKNKVDKVDDDVKKENSGVVLAEQKVGANAGAQEEVKNALEAFQQRANELKAKASSDDQAISAAGASSDTKNK